MLGHPYFRVDTFVGRGHLQILIDRYNILFGYDDVYKVLNTIQYPSIEFLGYLTAEVWEVKDFSGDTQLWYIKSIRVQKR